MKLPTFRICIDLQKYRPCGEIGKISPQGRFRLILFRNFGKRAVFERADKFHFILALLGVAFYVAPYIITRITDGIFVFFFFGDKFAYTADISLYKGVF